VTTVEGDLVWVWGLKGSGEMNEKWCRGVFVAADELVKLAGLLMEAGDELDSNFYEVAFRFVSNSGFSVYSDPSEAVLKIHRLFNLLCALWEDALVRQYLTNTFKGNSVARETFKKLKDDLSGRVISEEGRETFRALMKERDILQAKEMMRE